MKELASIFIFLNILIINSLAQNCLPLNGRFSQKVFANISVVRDITYGSADRYDAFNINNPQPIKLDFYAPQNDTMQKRPLVLMFFGGAFTLGDKSDADVSAWSDSLAHYGYAAASVNYRLGLNTLSQGSAIRAVYRAVQDARAAVRFFKENHQLYKIDTTRIFLLGESAGAIMSLQAAYFTNNSQIPSEVHGIGSEPSDLGCIDCSGNTFAHTVDIKGVVSLWGAVYKLSYLQPTPKIPTLLIHGTDDQIVKIGTGQPFSSPTFPVLYGSLPIHNRMDSLQIYNEFYPYQGQGHLIYGIPTITVTFPNQYWNPIFTQGKNFLYTILGQLCVATDTPQSKQEITVFPNPATDRLYIKLTNSTVTNTDISIQVTDIQGKVFLTKNNIIDETELNIANLPKGVYIITLQNNQTLFHSKFLKL